MVAVLDVCQNTEKSSVTLFCVGMQKFIITFHFFCPFICFIWEKYWMPPTKHLFGGWFAFQIEKKKVCFQIWLTLIGQFNNILVAYMNILLSFVILQKLWLEKWLTASLYWAKCEKWRKLYFIKKYWYKGFIM